MKRMTTVLLAASLLQESELRPFHETPQLILIAAGGNDSVVQGNPSSSEPFSAIPDPIRKEPAI